MNYLAKWDEHNWIRDKSGELRKRSCEARDPGMRSGLVFISALASEHGCFCLQSEYFKTPHSASFADQNQKWKVTRYIRSAASINLKSLMAGLARRALPSLTAELQEPASTSGIWMIPGALGFGGPPSGAKEIWTESPTQQKAPYCAAMKSSPLHFPPIIPQLPSCQMIRKNTCAKMFTRWPGSKPTTDLQIRNMESIAFQKSLGISCCLYGLFLQFLLPLCPSSILGSGWFWI